MSCLLLADPSIKGAVNSCGNRRCMHDEDTAFIAAYIVDAELIIRETLAREADHWLLV